MYTRIKKIRHLYRKGLVVLNDMLTSTYDVLCYYLRIPLKKLPDVFYQPGIILYVSDYNWPRLIRMAKWLKRTEPLTICLLCSKEGYKAHFDDTSCDGVALYRNAWHIRRIIRSLPNIRLIQGFGPKSYNLKAALVEAHCPYIHDLQDVIVTYYGPKPILRWQKKELPAERYCLEHAAGIVAESMEPRAAYEIYKTASRPKNLFFPLCCDNDYFQQHTRVFNPDDIHVAYAGQVHGSWRNKENFGNTQFFELIDILTKQKIHLHIYPSPTTLPADYNEYIAIAAQNSYFHYHSSVSQETLVREMSQYDFGLLPFFKGYSKISDTKLKYATTLKLFNYWEAGIPVIVSKDIFYQNWLLTRYKTGLTISSLDDFSHLKEIISKFSYPDLTSNVMRTREHLSLNKNIQRVWAFYKQLS